MKPFIIPTALVAFAAVCLLTPQSSNAQTSIPQRENPAMHATTATERVRMLTIVEQANGKASSTYAVETEALRNIAPEFLHEHKEVVPSTHARMPQMKTHKVVHSVDYAAIMPLLLKAVQEQQEEIERLRNELSLLKAQAVK